MIDLTLGEIARTLATVTYSGRQSFKVTAIMPEHSRAFCAICRSYLLQETARVPARGSTIERSWQPNATCDIIFFATAVDDDDDGGGGTKRHSSCRLCDVLTSYCGEELTTINRHFCVYGAGKLSRPQSFALWKVPLIGRTDGALL